MTVPRFLYWMEERELIRQRRAAGQPAPWTDDAVLRDNYFTNVMREYDRGSVWVQEHITDQYAQHRALPVMLGLARWLGHTPALEAVQRAGLWPIHGTREELVAVSAFLEARGEQVFTGAYVVSANGMRWGGWRSKIDYIVNGVVGKMVGVEVPTTSIQAATEALDALEGWGGFMSYEIACDLRWAPGWLDTAPDIHTWANPGPGCRRGLVDVFPDRGWGRRGPNAETALGAMRHLLLKAEAHRWDLDWPRRLEMRDIEHSLCEFSKYAKISRGGRGKRKYPLGG